jgi:DNA repair photolyase
MPKKMQRSLFGEEHAPVEYRDSATDSIVREIPCRSVLNRSRAMGYSFNCYTGCANACVYCYARFMQRFHPHEEAWGRFVDVKINATEVLARQVRRLPPGSVFTCSACDGWQAGEERYRLTRECARILLDAGFRLSILTKSALVLRDLDILAGRDVCLGVTITTPSERLAQLWEPGASSVRERMRILKDAKKAGMETTIVFGPLLPGFSDDPPSLRQLMSLAQEAQVDHIWTDAMNPRPRVWPSVRGFLETHHPELLPHYREVLFDSTRRQRYRTELGERVRAAASEAGLAKRLG